MELKITSDFIEEKDQLTRYILDLFVGIEDNPTLMLSRLEMFKLLFNKMIEQLEPEVNTEHKKHLKFLIDSMNKNIQAGVCKIPRGKNE